jgi:tellurite resistance protein TerC
MIHLNLFAAASERVAAYDVPWFMYAAIGVALVLYAIIEAIHSRHDHVVTFKEAIRWSAFYISIALLFTIPVYFFIGGQAAAEYVAAWAIEKALSLDNLFVFGLIFAAFKVEQKYRRRILNYGIAGAILFRLIFIVAGYELLKNFSWVSIIFGAVLIHAAWDAYKHARFGVDKEKKDVTKSLAWRAINKVFPIHHKFDGHKLVTRVNGKRMFTMMFGIIILIELTDIVFAVDSVPAVLAVSPDRYIAYASNIFALLGLRSLFFVYDSVAPKFWAIDWSLAAILLWIGAKMIASPLGFHPPVAVSLSVLFVILGAGVFASIFFKKPGAKDSLTV